MGSSSTRPRELSLILFFVALGFVLSSFLGLLLATSSSPDEALRFIVGWSMDTLVWRAILLSALGLGGLAVLLLGIHFLTSKVGLTARRSLESLTNSGFQSALSEVRERTLEALSGATPDVGLAVDELLRGALLVQASDLHVSPTSTDLKVTYRVHGSLHDVVHLNLDFATRIALRIKVLAQMDTYARRPQDGRLRHQVGEIPFEARVSSLPADFGERLVLRLVRGTRKVPELLELGFEPQVEQGLVEVLNRSQGMLFVSGPVGSGKTTSLYSSLAHIASTRGEMTSLVTLEDPIELQLPFATQTLINSSQGMSFAQTLRSVLRQDPNVLMLGEIRDRETAEIATQAGLTGHLILTTIHVESAAGTFARLMEMGVEPFVVSSATSGCLSQRLVRVLCPLCRRESPPDPFIVDRFQRLGQRLPEARYFEPVGCDRCEGQGYVSRMPVAELLIPTPEMREAILERRPTGEIQKLAEEAGMVPLFQAALSQAERGVTSLSEVLRVAG